MAEIQDILKWCVQSGASDILIVPGEPVVMRVNGALRKVDGCPPASGGECTRWIFSMLDSNQRKAYEAVWDLDCAYTIPEVARFRLNVFVQNHGPAAALRVVNSEIPSPEQAGLEPSIRALANLPRGLVLVTGPTGSGKTTTLACIIELINRTQNKHILTIEDPIEFTYRNKSSIIEQREVGRHTESFRNALKYALRQNPDIILVGEMRDAETIGLALTAAETGHLCFSTLHTQNAPSTISRVIDEFPGNMHDKIRAQLSSTLQGVVSQVLLPRSDGPGRVCAREVMLMTPGISSLIRDAKMHQIYGTMEASSSQGMMTLDQSIARLIRQGLVSLEEGMAKCQDIETLKRLVRMNAGPSEFNDPLASQMLGTR